MKGVDRVDAVRVRLWDRAHDTKAAAAYYAQARRTEDAAYHRGFAAGIAHALNELCGPLRAATTEGSEPHVG